MLAGQLDLFALANGPKLTPKQRRALGPRKSPQPNGYAKPPGSGPQGETCKSCAHIERARTRSKKTFRKCALMQAHWTHGPGSDIKASAPACSLWASPESMTAPTATLTITQRERLKMLTLEERQVVIAGRAILRKSGRIAGYCNLDELAKVFSIEAKADTVWLSPADYADVKRWLG